MMERASFGSRLGVILATAGSAVGLGNVWRFPYMTGQNGGAVFILIYVGCVLLLGIPCMISEFIIGRHAQANTARAYLKVGGKNPLSLIGYMSVLTGFLITGYYAVVSGWCLQYIWASILGHLNSGDPTYFKEYFVQFSEDPVKPIFWTLLMLLATYLIIEHGVRNGIERASKLLMPILFVLLLVLVIASCSLPGASRGIEFLLKPDFTKVSPSVFLEALGQAFFSLSLGTACLCTYASYFTKQTKLLYSATQIALIDFLIALMSGLMIFPAAFSVGVQPDSGPSLIFITLPNVFQQAFSFMPSLGYVISIMFYALLVFAALTSTISMHEIGTAFFHEELHINRSKAAWVLTIVCSVIAVFCSLSVGNADIQVLGKSLMSFCDFITAQVMLPAGAMLTSILVGWFASKAIVREEFTNWGTSKSKSFFNIYLFCVRFVVPVCILLIFLHEFGVI